MILLLAILAFVLVDVKFGHEEKALSARGPCSLIFPPNLDLGFVQETRYEDDGQRSRFNVKALKTMSNLDTRKRPLQQENLVLTLILQTQTLALKAKLGT